MTTTIDCEAPSRPFGPRPPRALVESEPVGRRVRGQVPGAIALLVAVIAVGGVLVARQGAAPAAATTRVAPRCAGAITRTGCRASVVWHAPVAELGGVRYQLGRVGDVLLLGDWACSGSDAPALYRPATGEVFVFGGWAAEGRPLAAQTRSKSGPRRGRPVVRRAAKGCDAVVVRAGEST